MKHIAADFPIFSQSQSRPFIYFDTASTAQKSRVVIDAMSHFYSVDYGQVHRGIYDQSERATELFEAARTRVAQFINAQHTEIVFTSGTTEGINFIASTWGKQLKAGDEIILTDLEHHSNLLPWVRLAQEQGVIIKSVPIDPQTYDLDYEAYKQLLSSRTRLVACTQSSNAIGTQVDLSTIISLAHQQGARVLVDAAQAAGHKQIDVQKMKPDFLVFSGHKLGGPTGIGILYIRTTIQSEVPPYRLGGGMLLDASLTHYTVRTAPYCYEAGTPAIAQAIGLAAAIDYLESAIPYEDIQRHEATLCAKLIEGLADLKEITIRGSLEQLRTHGHLVSFTVEGYHPHDIAAYLNTKGIAVRAGTHCCQPLYKKLGISGSIRVSFFIYNTLEEVDLLVQALRDLIRG